MSFVRLLWKEQWYIRTDVKLAVVWITCHNFFIFVKMAINLTLNIPAWKIPPYVDSRYAIPMVHYTEDVQVHRLNLDL